MALAEVAPITQRSDSSRFDLPQPLGPTTPVRPGSIMKSVVSTKDLKPVSRRRVIRIDRLVATGAGDGDVERLGSDSSPVQPERH